jgi:hypothetical protein
MPETSERQTRNEAATARRLFARRPASVLTKLPARRVQWNDATRAAYRATRRENESHE